MTGARWDAKSGETMWPEAQLEDKEKSKEKGKEKSKEKILGYLSVNPSATTAELAEITKLSISGVEKNIRELKTTGRLRRVGADKGGHWEVIERA